MEYIKNLNSRNIIFKKISNNYKLSKILTRPNNNYENIINLVGNIEKTILKKGDKALSEFTEKYDGVILDSFAVSQKEILESENYISDGIKESIMKAKDNIEKFHKRQVPINLKSIKTSNGVYCWRKFEPIEKIGLYIPGGTAPLFSSVLMLGIPAIIAGCSKIQICTPPNKDGKITSEILYTAKLLGISDIFKIGGAQAIFAMGHGTCQIPKVNKIFGPGNSFVTAAKIRMSETCAIDMPAGPSEVLIIADEKSIPKFVAADLLSQCEHGKDSQSILLCNSRKITQEIIFECQRQLLYLSKKDLITESMKNSLAIITSSIEEAIDISNQYAPEHLILQISDWRKYMNKIKNAGSVFCGKYSPESAGDYCSGTNHTLPTNGFAKSYSGIGIESFGKRITFQRITKNGLKEISSIISNLTLKEGLTGHNNAVEIRL